MKLTVAGCLDRQKRLRQVLEKRGLKGAIISRRDHVYYFTGFQSLRFFAGAALIETEGSCTLVGADFGSDKYAADELIEYPGAFYSTMHSEQFEAVADKLRPFVANKSCLGVDLGGGIACVAALAGNDAVDITRDIYRLRKAKHEDELHALQAAISLTEAMYDSAKNSVRPGVDEVDVLAELRATITRAAGEDLEFIGNDFQANAMGGLARRRLMEAGELYILDAGVCLHGYYADNCRTISVDRSPTDVQMKVWERIDGVFSELESAVQPGVLAGDLFTIANNHFDGHGFSGMVHHLSHGVGMSPHETPEINPEYEAVFEVGDVFTMEPGLYSPELKAGIRLEENYYLSKSGLQKLTKYSRNLC